ncbi:MAG: hypothetical protein LBQ66_02530 [Planctomycetaceae bacterium]|jgi:hypothetical protein|nr:hypothetical protein [Planctomycetaceae bacterium]
MKGPCPSCKTVIDIPKASVKIHGEEELDYSSGSTTNATGKTTAAKRIPSKPISRLDFEFKVDSALHYLAVTAGVIAFALLIGLIVPRGVILNIIGVIGVCAIAFPISLFGYQLLRDREELFMLTGSDLHQKTGACAVAYAATWIAFEIFIWYMRADNIFVWIYFAAFAMLAVLLCHAILDINFGNSVFHFMIFFLAVILLRGITNIGWLWNVTKAVRDTSPILPGMPGT